MKIMSFSSADLAVSFSHLRTASSFGHGFEPYCVDIVIIWTPCFKILFFHLPNKVPEFITPDPLVLKGHTVPHFKGLVCTYMEFQVQNHNVYLSIFCTLLKMGVFEANMQFNLVSFN